MKKLIIALVLLATVSSTYAKINAVTGQQEDMSWLAFSKLIARNPTALTRYTTGLQFAEIGIVAGAGIGDFTADPTSAKLKSALTDENGAAGKVLFAEGTLVITSGKTATITNTMTFAGTDARTHTFPTTNSTIARTDAGQTFTGTQTFGAVVVTTLNGHTFTAGSSVFNGTAGQTYTFPSTTAALARTDAGQTFTGASTITSWIVTSPVITTGLTASGAAANDFSGSTGTFKTSSGLNTFSGGIVAATQSLSGGGAVNLTSVTTKLISTGVDDALSLANGTEGQIKILVHEVDGGSAILTPTTKTGFTTITFTAEGDSCMLVYVTTRGWMTVSLNGATEG